MPSRTKHAEYEVDNEPPVIDPYDVLGLEKAATADQVKAAYRKAALKHHPDKAAPDEKETAHANFQEIAFAYAILSDERRRKRYDATGNTSESLDIDDDDFDWVDFFREQFESVVNEESIMKFANEYKGSEEERKHVLAAYEQSKGAMAKLYEHVMLSDMLEDEDRFRAIIDKAIEVGEVEAYKKYAEETEAARKKRMDQERKRRDKEAKEAEIAAKDLEENGKSKKKARKGADDISDLAALIQQRQKGRGADFLANLEEKYAAEQNSKSKKGTKRSAMDEPPEEAFAKNRKGREKDAAEGSRKSKRSKKA